ncbi:MAG: hypothetical protein ABI836_06810 [Gemmatimonadota bacterium]
MMRLHTRGLRQILALLLFVVYLPSCVGYKVQSGTPAAVLAGRNIRLVRVTLVDGHKVWLQQPTISNDSLIGKLYGSRHAELRAIPTDSVKAIAVPHTNVAATFALVGVAALATLTIVAASMDPIIGAGASSCPQVYSWNGHGWRLDSGTFGGAIAPAFARTDVDNLTYAVPEGERLRLRLANALDETDYVDGLSVLAVDHGPGVTVAPSADGTIHTLGTLLPPTEAFDDRGRDVLQQILTTDDWSWESALYQRDTSLVSEIRDDIDLTFPRPTGARTARLVIEGHNSAWAGSMMQDFVAAHGRSTQAWYDSLAENPLLARQTGANLAREGFLDVQLRKSGMWVHQDYAWEAGPEISKKQVISLDLTGVTEDSIQVRLESAPMFWLIDQVAIDYSQESPIQVHELTASRAVSDQGEDVSGLLNARDHSYYVMERGDGAELSFTVPPVPAGLTRSYLLRSTGWYRIHTAETDPADLATLAQVSDDRHGASRLEVARFNRALATLSQEKP